MQTPAAMAQDCDPTDIFAPQVRYDAGSSPQGLAVGDLNGDGSNDIVVANTGVFGAGNDVSVLLNQCIAPGPQIVTQPGPFVLLLPGGGVSGATTPTLTIDATVEDTDADTLVVRDDFGQTLSDGAIIAVRVPCRADFDDDGSLTLFDFLTFRNAFDAGCP